jgi:hypothetical protein
LVLLEFVGAQEGRDHVGGDQQRGGGVDKLDDHGAQTRFSPSA